MPIRTAGSGCGCSWTGRTRSRRRSSPSVPAASCSSREPLRRRIAEEARRLAARYARAWKRRPPIRRAPLPHASGRPRRRLGDPARGVAAGPCRRPRRSDEPGRRSRRASSARPRSPAFRASDAPGWPARSAAFGPRGSRASRAGKGTSGTSLVSFRSACFRHVHPARHTCQNLSSLTSKGRFPSEASSGRSAYRRPQGDCHVRRAIRERQRGADRGHSGGS